MINRTSTAALILILLTLVSSPLMAQETTDYYVSWVPNPEPDIDGYVIYRSLYTSLATFQPIDSVDASTFSYIDTGIPQGTTYYYRIIAKNTGGDRSPYSNPVSGFTIPQDASEATKDRCRIISMDRNPDGTYDVTWVTQSSTIGFIQYDRDGTLDQMSDWDDSQYSTSHTITLSGLISPQTYYLRAISYDGADNMVISALDTLEISGENPTPVSAPVLSIYPVPYNPGMGTMHFDNLPAGGSVTVINGSGLEVWNERLGSETTTTWDGINNQGSPVMSGVYYVIVKNSSGTVVDKRPVMVVH
jgi:hypothetical protein